MSEHGGNTNGCGCPIGNCDCDPVVEMGSRMSVQHRDVSNLGISPGDFVVYAALWDRSAVLKFGIVTRLGLSKPRYSYKLEKHNVQEPTVRVITADRSVYIPSKGFSKDWELQKDGKEVALSFCDRLLIVDDGSVPERARKLLLEAYQKRVLAELSKR